MREPVLFKALRDALGHTARAWFRVVHFSVQANHVHIIVEANDGPSLARGMTGLSVRLARAFNRALGRRGPLWGDRYHARPLRTPREVRNALVYVLMNRRKHGHSPPRRPLEGYDACSSAWWFDGWERPPKARDALLAKAPPVQPAETWLARIGWKRHGLIRDDERPAPSL